eukprot:NODE_550_length_2114_cov_35.921065_g507_i0.p1 GENE.NODE_550_length_2114_cov_35.921065_g507_i0~~NODE_550_length_2114_cov_35.921065_g507_i0.p1  ORF type:complete len:642 (-),score=121.13 NODE_550_length_2114_cov_35.921065_g507_i0:61-1986(-)
MDDSNVSLLALDETEAAAARPRSRHREHSQFLLLNSLLRRLGRLESRHLEPLRPFLQIALRVNEQCQPPADWWVVRKVLDPLMLLKPNMRLAFWLHIFERLRSCCSDPHQASEIHLFYGSLINEGNATVACYLPVLLILQRDLRCPQDLPLGQLRQYVRDTLLLQDGTSTDAATAAHLLPQWHCDFPSLGTSLQLLILAEVLELMLLHSEEGNTRTPPRRLSLRSVSESSESSDAEDHAAVMTSSSSRSFTSGLSERNLPGSSLAMSYAKRSCWKHAAAGAGAGAGAGAQPEPNPGSPSSSVEQQIRDLLQERERLFEIIQTLGEVQGATAHDRSKGAVEGNTERTPCRSVLKGSHRKEKHQVFPKDHQWAPLLVRFEQALQDHRIEMAELRNQIAEERTAHSLAVEQFRQKIDALEMERESQKTLIESLQRWQTQHRCSSLEVPRDLVPEYNDIPEWRTPSPMLSSTPLPTVEEAFSSDEQDLGSAHLGAVAVRLTPAPHSADRHRYDGMRRRRAVSIGSSHNRPETAVHGVASRYPPQPYFGLEVAEDRSGVLVVSVQGPAAESGILPGDLVREVSNVPVRTMDDFQRVMLAARSCAPMAILVQRGSGLHPVLLCPVPVMYDDCEQNVNLLPSTRVLNT